MKTKRCGMERVIAEIEALAKRVRAEVRRATHDSGLTKNLEMARRRKEGFHIAELIEQYVHGLRMQLMRAPAAPRRARRGKRAA
jgi:hypothetical protein